MSDISTIAAKVEQLQARLSAYVAPLSVQTPRLTPVGSAGTRVGGVLNCTRGVWDNGVATYAYQWKSAAANVGSGAASYTPVTGDVGAVVTCVVSATNATGTTAAPASNGVTISS